MKVEISNRRKAVKFTNMWRFNNMLMNNNNKKSQKEIKKYLLTN